MRKSAFLLLLLLFSVSFMAYDIQPAGSVGIIINYDGSVEGSDKIQRDGDVYTLTDDINGSITVLKSGVVVDGAGHTLYGGGANRGIECGTGDSITIRNFKVVNFYHGIYLRDGSHSIVGNSISDCSFVGIIMESSGSNYIFGNNITNNGNGIYTRYASSADNIISRNNITSNNNGIRSRLGARFTIIGNRITNNHYDGIQFEGVAGSRIIGNDLINNGHLGISLFYHASGHKFYHNNIINNSVGAEYTVSGTSGDNGYPSGGNYWSIYAGSDLYKGPYQNETGSDGIGDTPHGVDNYPLMNPWIPPEYTIAVNSSPTGITFKSAPRGYDSSSRSTPWSGAFIEGTQVMLFMPEGQDGYAWSHWLDDEDAPRVRGVTMGTNAAVTAVFTPDPTPPTISILSPSTNTYAVKDVDLNFTVSEPPVWIGYSLDGQANVTAVGNTTLSDLSEGAHNVVVYANDTAENMGHSEPVYFTIDTVPPHLEIISPENKTYASDSVNLDFIIHEPVDWIGYSLDGQTNITTTETTTLTHLSDGMHSLIVYARDLAGNIDYCDLVHFTIARPPGISILAPENKTYDTANITLTFTIDEPVLWMAYSLDGQTNIAIGNMTLSGIPDGPHSLIVYAKDAAGNTGASEAVHFSVEAGETGPLQLWSIVAIAAIAVVGTFFLILLIRRTRR